MRVALKIFSACLLAGAVPYAWANGGSAMPRPSMPAVPREQTPQQQAHDAYNDGVHEVKKADKAQASANESADAGKKAKALKEAQERYGAALAKFEHASGLDPTLAEAWNYLGYTRRKLGHYDEALEAYSRALSLKPGYPDALEYRGEAFLALNRIPDAQQTYLDLYAGNRALAGKLLTAMKDWVAGQRAHPADQQGANLDELDKWIQERSQIAGQTAALTRAGTAASWR